MAIRTIFSMSEDCARGARQGWSEFVRDYAVPARALLDHFFPTLRPELDEHVTGVFRKAHADRNAWFHNLRFSNDREFFIAFRELVFVYGRAVVRLPAPPISDAQARDLLRDLTVVERELLWTLMKGYDTSQVAAILMNAATTTAAMAETARLRLERLGPGNHTENGIARALMEFAESSATSDCLPARVMNNIINGQVSWQERDRAEQHIADCPHCLDRFTSLQESIWLHRQKNPLPDAKVDRLLVDLGFKAGGRRLLGKLFSKTA